MLGIKITDKKKSSVVSYVEFTSNSIRNGSFDENVYIELEDGTEINFDGEHGVKDFEDQFGFIVEEL